MTTTLYQGSSDKRARCDPLLPFNWPLGGPLSPTDTNDEAIFLQMMPMMGHYSVFNNHGH